MQKAHGPNTSITKTYRKVLSYSTNLPSSVGLLAYFPLAIC